MFYFLIILICIIVDQLTKYWVFSKKLTLHLLPFLSIQPVYNTGFIFGLFSNLEGILRTIFYLSIPLILLFLFIWILIRSKDSLFRLGLSFIIGGGIGNVTDRLILNKVRDFIDFHIGNWHYPTFNVADVCVDLGIAILLFYFLFVYKPPKGD